MTHVVTRTPMEKTLMLVGTTPALLAMTLVSACGAGGSAPAGGSGTGDASPGQGAMVALPATAGTGGASSVKTGAGGVSGAGTGANPGVGGMGGAMTGTGGVMAGTGGAKAGTGGTMAGTGGATAGTGGAMAGTGGTGGTVGTPQKSSGCGMAPPSGDTSVMVGSATGPFILDMPANYDNTHAYPLVLVWHGAGVTNTAFHDYLNMHAVIGNDAILVTPECTDGSSWPNDPSYFDALLEHFSTKYCIDKSRVFSTGHSMGGMHTALLACQRADKLRGDAVLAAPHSMGMCVKGNMGVMMSVGMSDFVATYTTEFTYWAQYGGCDANMKMAVDPMTFTTGTPEESGHCDDYGGCTAGTAVRTCTFAGGHEIPGWVAGAVWSFFKKLM